MEYLEKMPIIGFRLHSLPIIIFFTFSVIYPAWGADNSKISKADVEKICLASLILCEESCNAAVYTSAQRSVCGANCASIRDQCVGSVVRSKSIIGDVNTGGVLMREGQKKKRKKLQKQ